MGNYLNGSVGHTQTDPNALGESDLWVLNGNIKDLSRLVEQGISNSDVERIPQTQFNGGVCQFLMDSTIAEVRVGWANA